MSQTSVLRLRRRSKQSFVRGFLTDVLVVGVVLAGAIATMPLPRDGAPAASDSPPMTPTAAGGGGRIAFIYQASPGEPSRLATIDPDTPGVQNVTDVEGRA